MIVILSELTTMWRDTNMTTHAHADMYMHTIPVCILCVASMTAFMPDAHTLLTVEQTVVGGRPAPKAACRAGACAPYTKCHLHTSLEKQKEDFTNCIAP